MVVRTPTQKDRRDGSRLVRERIVPEESSDAPHPSFAHHLKRYRSNCPTNLDRYHTLLHYTTIPTCSTALSARRRG